MAKPPAVKKTIDGVELRKVNETAFSAALARKEWTTRPGPLGSRLYFVHATREGNEVVGGELVAQVIEGDPFEYWVASK